MKNVFFDFSPYKARAALACLGLGLAIIFTALALSGCGKPPTCQTAKVGAVTTVTCDGTTFEVSDGAQGATGVPGKDGVSLVSTTIPDKSGQCANGGTVVLLAQDTNNTGVWSPDDKDQSSFLVCNGAQGPQGAPGQNATPVNPVQFCPGYSVTYPSTFPEFGLCLNGSIFAVYWDKSNAWLAEVPPGKYLSTSTSAPCDFTVLTGCQISN